MRRRGGWLATLKWWPKYLWSWVGFAYFFFRRPVVIEWLDENASGEYEARIGGLGGWVRGEGWDEYLRTVAWPHERPFYNALRKRILDDCLRIGGDDHQRHFTPLFSDLTTGSFSFRAWGDLCAAIYNTAEGTSRYEYMDFYMTVLVEQ